MRSLLLAALAADFAARPVILRDGLYRGHSDSRRPQAGGSGAAMIRALQ